MASAAGNTLSATVRFAAASSTRTMAVATRRKRLTSDKGIAPESPNILANEGF
jgi:hypothetical protein